MIIEYTESLIWTIVRIGCLPFTWANRSVHGVDKWFQSSGLVNFAPESRLPFVKISSIYLKTTAKTWNWYQRWLWRNRTRISLWNIPSGKTGLPFQMFRCSRKFSVWKTQKVSFHLLFNQISRKIFANGKQPLTADVPQCKNVIVTRWKMEAFLFI